MPDVLTHNHYRSSVWGPAALLLLGLFLAAYALLRANMMDATYSAIVGCQACFYKPALAHDLSMLGFVLGYFVLLMSLSSQWVRLALLVPVLTLLLLLLADLAVFHLLSQRLLVSDLVKFRHEFDAMAIIAKKSFSPTHFLAAAGLAISSAVMGMCVWRSKPFPNALSLAGLVIAMGIAAGAGIARGKFPGYVHADAGIWC